MKFTFLGTSACEGIPALFCNCACCVAARAKGGQNVRTRAQALVGDDLLIDFPPDTLYHFHKSNIEGHKIKSVLLTHSHSDHFCPKEFSNRGARRCYEMDVDVLHVYCSQGAFDKFSIVKLQEDYVQLHLIKAFDVFQVGDYRVTALPAKHHPGDEAVNYLIEGEKTILYALDTGYFYEEVFDYLSQTGIQLDMAVYDCSAVERSLGKELYHMGVPEVRDVVMRLRELGVVTDQTLNCISHFSHTGHALQSELEALVKEDGFLVAYDGRIVEI